MIRLPELEALDRPSQLLRIPEQMDVPLTPRVTRLVDARSFRRLAGIRQLGFVSLVYPGAMHTRFEHSLGVYRNALLFLRQLLPQPDFARQVDSRWCEQFLVAALLHDLG
ncbi:MAG: metal-dependent phosphohydrolase, partial [Planctomycetota bacterium]